MDEIKRNKWNMDRIFKKKLNMKNCYRKENGLVRVGKLDQLRVFNYNLGI